MLNLFQIGVEETCKGLLPIIKIIRQGLFPIIQIGIPILLIVLGTIDLGKAVISSDDKEVKASQGRLIKRCIYAVAIFFIFTLVSLIMSLVAYGNTDETGDLNDTGWSACWTKAGE